MIKELLGTSFTRIHRSTSADGDKIKQIWNLPSVKLSSHNEFRITTEIIDDSDDNDGLLQQSLSHTSSTYSTSDETISSFQLQTSQSRTSSVSMLTIPSCASVIGGDPAFHSILEPGCHSIEIFFGRVSSLESFYKVLCHNFSEDEYRNEEVRVPPDAVRKLVLVGHPLTSFSGMNRFVKLAEAWITHCNIHEANWTDFKGMTSLHRFYINNCNLQQLEPLRFGNLRALWIAENHLTSLSFLDHGLPCLEELNAARNQIGCLETSQFLKCPNIRNINLSGNPLFSIQDIVALKVISNLHTLYLADPVYGKCPVSAHCDSRTMLLSILDHISILDGKPLMASESSDAQDYVTTRGLYYYNNSSRILASQAVFRRTTMMSTNKKLDAIGYRLEILLSLISRYRRVISNVKIIPIFTNAKNLMREQIDKIENRMTMLTTYAAIALRRLELVMQISHWEQEAEKWIKWVEFQSFGNTQCHMIHSVHGPLVGQPNELCSSLHELIGSLSCTEMWPHSMTTKVETIVVVRDIGMDKALQNTYERYFGSSNEPQFIQPDESPDRSPPSTGVANSYITSTKPPVTTYLSPDFRLNPPLYPYPNSIPGLPEIAQPIFMFLVCPSKFLLDPLGYFHRVVNNKAIHYSEIKLTNCLWSAAKNKGRNFLIVIVVKVLPQALQSIPLSKSELHSEDCGNFLLIVPQAMSPCYIVTVSVTPQNDHKAVLWRIGAVGHDEDITRPAKSALVTLTDKIIRHGHPTPLLPGQTKKSQFIRKVSDGGILADFSATLLHITKDGDIDCRDWSEVANSSVPQVQSIAKFFEHEANNLTTVDLSGNKLQILIGLENLGNLRKLNLSHNKLISIASLTKLNGLIELKLGWNSLKHLHSTAITLETCTPRLLTLDILPNSFVDIREYGHIPVILKRILPGLNRIDTWIGLTEEPPPEIPIFSPIVPDTNLNHVALSDTWRSYFSYQDLTGKCLTDLDIMPQNTPIPEGSGIDGMELNLSNNYLTSLALNDAAFIIRPEWKTVVIKLELQENNISNLDWLKDQSFPNLMILNLANNMITELDVLPQSCRALRHVFLCSNPLPCDSIVLFPLRLLKSLRTLDCTGSPVSSHAEYSLYVIRYLVTVKMLDGVPMSKWQIINQVQNIGGVLTQDWLEDRLGQGNRNWSTLTQLSLPNSNLQKITLPGNALPHLLTLNLHGNRLTSFTSLSVLPALRVLCMSQNRVSSMGSDICPTCYSNTVQSQTAIAMRSQRLMADMSYNSYSLNPMPTPRKPKPIFPKLEVLILSHNDISSLNDLHFHAMPVLQTIMLNCNKIKCLEGLDDLPLLKAIVLDQNRIKDVPFNCFNGCKSLRYLHLEHNRLTALPRLPNLANMTNLHIGYNKIQNLTDISCLSKFTDLSMTGNPMTRKLDYRFKVAACMPFLNSLDGKSLAGEKLLIQDFQTQWFPGGLPTHPLFDREFVPRQEFRNRAPIGGVRKAKAKNRRYYAAKKKRTH